MPTVKGYQSCGDCRGTGIYRGMGELDQVGVQCSRCKGKGWYEVEIDYLDEQPERKKRKDVTWIYQVNPGIGLALGLGGGMPYQAWWEGAPWQQGMELRNYSCPAWWYQSADYAKKPSWKECALVGTFSECKHFATKHECWARWDKEFGNAN